MSGACPLHVQHVEAAVNYFRAFASPLIVVAGIFGNGMALVLFLSHKPWNRFSIYATSLAISDTLVLVLNTFLDDFLGRGLYFLTNKRWMIKLDATSLEACRFMELTGCWFAFTSGALLVAFNVDRVACLYLPLRCRPNGGICIAAVCSAAIMTLGFFLSIPVAALHNLVVGEVEEGLPNMTCGNCQNSSTQIGKELLRERIHNSSLHNTEISVSCAIGTDETSGRGPVPSFVVSTLFTYMAPCLFLIITSVLIAYKLISVKRKREVLQNTLKTSEHLARWNEMTKNSDVNHVEDKADQKPITSLIRRQRSMRMESRRENCRMVALFSISCFYLCFTFPVAVALCIRSALNYENPDCQHLFHAHFTRLLTSVKDINYALNGYIYPFFFQFYRAQMLKVSTCGLIKSRPARQNDSHATCGLRSENADEEDAEESVH
ncbi:unnamed protein product [Calicophoron daubneyi]|uniref:G-protein coupled receptors family 1 profile domain-containing protein n=1 Tax=Calicophoron daubneyi TaxID=300641 RepID=A0AAV2TLL5_CALDB